MILNNEGSMANRIAMGVEYDGSAFCGWQTQCGVPTVQQAVEAALTKVAASPISVICAGRTDTGVHAAEQVVHFETAVQRDNRAWVFGANRFLADQVSVLWATPVIHDFHARFSAVRRRYQYIIFNRAIRPSYLRKRVTWIARPLNEQRMAQATCDLMGEHDFSSYRAVACQASTPIRQIYELSVQRFGLYIIITIEANAFLQHMVRNIAGVLIDIGCGKQSPGWAKMVLEHRDRTQGGVTALPYGLYLQQVSYPDKFSLPQLSPSNAVW